MTQLPQRLKLAKRRLCRTFKVVFVDHHNGFDATDEAGGQIAVQQVGAWRRLGRNHDQCAVNVGSDGAKSSAPVTAAKAVCARNSFLQGALAVDMRSEERRVGKEGRTRRETDRDINNMR